MAPHRTAEIKTEQVFLEKAEKRSSRTGDGIPRGILLLTNRRLFFFNTGTGEIDKHQSHSISTLAIKLGSGMIFHGSELLELHFEELLGQGIELLDGKLEGMEETDFKQLLQMEDSFVIPVLRCQILRFGCSILFYPF